MREIGIGTARGWCRLRLRVFGLGGDEDGNVGVGAFPKRKELLISSSALSGVAGHGAGACEAQVSQRPIHMSGDEAMVVEDFLKLGRSLFPGLQFQICQATI